MNILIVSQYFYPENFRVNDLAVAFVERGHRVTVLTGIPNYPSGRFFEGYGLFGKSLESWRGIEIFRAPLCPRGSGRGIRLALNYLSFAAAASIIAVARLSRNFDVIFVHEPSPITVGIPAIVMKWLCGAPIFFWVLDLWPESVTATSSIKHPIVINILTQLTKRIYSHCHRLLVQSRGFIAHAKSMGVDEARIRYFPSWAEDLYLSEDLIVEDIPALPEGFRIIFAGNIGVAQSFPDLLDAAELLKHRADIQWIIVGDGRMQSWVGEEIERRGLQRTVHLMGRYPVEKMPAFFSQADVLLVSLKKETIFASTIPGKIQSYLAFGKPILAMLDGEGARIVSEAGAGLTCPAENAQALANAAEELAAKSHAELETMGKRGRDYYEINFNRDLLFSKLEKWMQEELGNSGCAG
jgi:glycosyltransferase involved in cell wall biosynthesis